VSEIPPFQPAGDPNSQEPQYAAYPRYAGAPVYGDPDKLQALADGYFGLNIAFLFNVLLAIALSGIVTALQEPAAWLIGWLIMLIAITFITLPHNKRVGEGKGWGQSVPLVVSILIGLNSIFCCGAIGYVVVQMIAIDEMKKHGIKGGTFSLRKKVVEEHIRVLRQAQMQAPPPSYQTPGNP
jgi:hypothetical protein